MEGTMKDPARRIGAYAAFAKRAAPLHWRKIMTTKNEAAAPRGFERTVASHDIPQFGAEMAARQSLADGRRALQQAGLAKFFKRDKGWGGKR
jgi:hypothetical protein